MAEIVITSSILILVLIGFRKLCWGKISRRLQYGLWLLVAIRLLVPAQFMVSPFSVMNGIEYVKDAVWKESNRLLGQTGEKNSGQTAGMTAVGEQLETDSLHEKSVQRGTVEGAGVKNRSERDQDAELYAESGRESGRESGARPGIYSRENLLSGGSMLKRLLGRIWIAGMIVIGSCLLVCNFRFHRRLSAGRQLIGREGRLKVYLAACLNSPCLWGFPFPAIYLNEASLASGERKEYILLHEKTHYRHLDHIWTFVRCLCLVVYWFHPLVWVAAAFAAEDSELACDEGTLQRLGEEHRQAYGCMLIEMMTGKSAKGQQLLCCATGMVNGKKEIKERVLAIAACKKQAVWISALAAGFALLLSACTAGAADQELAVGEREVGLQEAETSLQERKETALQAQDAQSALLQNADGSYRLSEYAVDLTGDKTKERIVFDIKCFDGMFPEGTRITEELLWSRLWENAVEISVKILEGEDENAPNETAETILQEYSYSIVHVGNGNLAAVRYENKNCILRYGNEVYQGRGRFWYQVWQIQPSGQEHLLLKENEAIYATLEAGETTEEAIAQVVQLGEELDGFLENSNNEILVNASANKDACYLYGGEDGLINGRRWQNGFDVFMTEVGGTGLELKIQDYFYPDGMEGTTQLPKQAEDWVRNGNLLVMEVSKENTTAGRLDLDGDGEKEVLYLEGVTKNLRGDGYAKWQNGEEYLDDRYRIRVNQTYWEEYCDTLNPVLMAFSPDRETILLAVFDEGPSGDPVTTFYAYDENGVRPAGSIPDDLREAALEDGVITCTFRGDMLETQWAWGYYYWNGSEIVRREDEVYYYIDESEWRKEIPLVLLQELTVYEAPSEDSTPLTMVPQEVSCLASDMREWVLLEAADGTKGWIRVVGFKLPSLENKAVYEVFDGLNMAG